LSYASSTKLYTFQRTSLSPEDAIRLLIEQKVKGIKLIDERRFAKADIEPWKNKTKDLLRRAFGTDQAESYTGAFSNWQAHAYGYDDDFEEAYAEDVRSALPTAINTLGEAIELLEKLPQGSSNRPKGKRSDDLWGMLHRSIVEVAQSRFDAGHLADAVEAALKQVNHTVKSRVKPALVQDLDGAKLMKRVFSIEHPLLVLGDLSTESGRSMQQGYMEIFAGAMTGIRNPKAHANIHIDEDRAWHFLILASLLMYKVDEAVVPK